MPSPLAATLNVAFAPGRTVCPDGGAVMAVADLGVHVEGGGVEEDAQSALSRELRPTILDDLGLTPAINGTPQQAATSALSSIFNQSLVQRLSQVDAQVIPLNIPLLLNEAFADPARFGLGQRVGLENILKDHFAWSFL